MPGRISSATSGRPGRDEGRITALNGVRGLAIVLVMVFHFTSHRGMEPRGMVDHIYYHVATTGWMGVDLFFVLSGFLITGILLRSRDRPGYFRTFYARRTLRIFPLYLAFLAFVFVLL